mgnify:CR=1 FL=1
MSSLVRIRSVFRRSALLASLTFAAFGQPSDADACGGAFFASDKVSVKGHQMAVSISKTQTIVWDRVEMNGSPEEFAYVVPLRPGARLELASEQFFVALDARTAPVVHGPSHSGCQGGGGGCLAGCGSAAEESSATPEVTVVARANAGPYESVHLRTDVPDALPAWLRANGFKIPDAVAPTIDAYVAEGFDFVALKLRPGIGSESTGLQPLRLVTPGADPTLPLRMSRAGVTDRAALSLYVIGEGRWRVRGFAEERVKESDLVINRSSQKSNYDEVAETQLRRGDGRTWLLEAAVHLNCYDRQCAELPLPDTYCEEDPISLTGDGSTVPDAGFDAQPDGDPDASTDAGDAGEPENPNFPYDAGVNDPPADPTLAPCARTDWTMARAGMDARSIWITRLRGSLAASSFAADLRFEASPDQVDVQPFLEARESGSGASITASHPSAFGGTLATWGATLFGLAWMLTSRRRR